MKLPIFQVDAFTNQRFTGNPAAVVFCESALSDSLMQSIAAENNLTETAFVYSSSEGREIRWFTPTTEVDLCGHATLAAAHIIFNHLSLDAEQITFSSRSGELHVHKSEDLLWLDFPADQPKPATESPKSLSQLLSVPVDELYQGRNNLLAIVDNEALIHEIKPEFASIAKLPYHGVIVSSAGSSVDFVSRFFAPQSGISEDPVTGSAHTTLTPFWSDRLGKQHMVARQLSARGGELCCKHNGDRVAIGGHAITFLTGEITL